MSGPSRRFAVGVALLAALGGLMLLPGLGRITVQREQELRVVLTARTMAQGGSWVMPVFRDQPRLRKPPLMYWIVATTYLLADHNYSAAVARLPGAAAGIGLLLTLYLAGSRLIGRSRAFTAAIACCTTFLFMRYARHMETDITLSLFVMLSTLAGYAALVRPPEGLRWWSFAGIAGGIGFMVKGPAAVAIPILTWIAFALLKPRRIRNLLTLRAAPGLLLAALIAVPWYATIFYLTRTNSDAAEQLARELSATFTDSVHNGSILYYVYTLLHALLPWSLLFPFALWHAARQRHHQGVRFILAWFVVAFACLSAIDSKQMHYTTLLLPQSALIIGLYAAPPSYRSALRRHRIIGKAAGVVVALLAGAGMGIAVAPWAGAHIQAIPAACMGGLIVGLAILGAALRDARKVIWLVIPLQLATAIAAYATLLHSLDEPRAVVHPFMASARNDISRAPHAYVVGPQPAFLEFHAGRDLKEKASLRDAWSAAEDGDVILASGATGQSVKDSEFPAPPRIDMARDEFRCVLFVKTRGDAP
jgi:4-amino-4-deoxy-L-arabinose transferase-like glycosyltransferase